ncbi:MAG: molybdopterin-binding protein [Nitrososphaerales archaeon]
MAAKLSARNQIRGKITKVKKGDIVGLVEIELSMPAKITSVITTDSIEQMGLAVGDEVNAVVKATEVMVSK